jgi:hypothetical protein
METSIFCSWKKLRWDKQQNASKKFQSHSMDRHTSLSFKMWPLCIVTDNSNHSCYGMPEQNSPETI